MSRVCILLAKRKKRNSTQLPLNGTGGYTEDELKRSKGTSEVIFRQLTDQKASFQDMCTCRRKVLALWMNLGKQPATTYQIHVGV